MLLPIVRSHILKDLIHDVKARQDITTLSTARNAMCEGIIKMLTPQSGEVSSSQPIVLLMKVLQLLLISMTMCPALEMKKMVMT